MWNRWRVIELRTKKTTGILATLTTEWEVEPVGPVQLVSSGFSELEEDATKYHLNDLCGHNLRAVLT